MAQIQDSGELKKISLKRLENKLEVHIEVDKLLSYKSFPLSNPKRFVIDLFQVKKFSCDSRIEVTDFGIKAIRVGKFQPDVTRVVFDLAESPPSYKIQESSKGLIAIFWFGEEKKEKVLEETLPEIQKEIPKKEEEKTMEKIPPKIQKEIPKEEKKPEKRPIPILPREIIEQEEAAEEEEKMTFSIGAKGGFYFMHASRFQDIYGKSSLFTGVEAVFKFPLRKKEYIGISLGFKYISDKGLISYEKSKLEIIPVTLSALYLRQYRIFFPYVGIGVDYYNYSENSPETFDEPLHSGKTWGFNIQAGTYLYLTSSLSLKLFIKYQSARLKENNRNINLGGNVYGLVLAYHFKIKI